MPQLAPVPVLEGARADDLPAPLVETFAVVIDQVGEGSGLGDEEVVEERRAVGGQAEARRVVDDPAQVGGRARERELPGRACIEVDGVPVLEEPAEK
ncbi:hypothetical protein D3C74_439520 [compost metagenome]